MRRLVSLPKDFLITGYPVSCKSRSKQTALSLPSGEAALPCADSGHDELWRPCSVELMHTMTGSHVLVACAS